MNVANFLQSFNLDELRRIRSRFQVRPALPQAVNRLTSYATSIMNGYNANHTSLRINVAEQDRLGVRANATQLGFTTCATRTRRNVVNPNQNIPAPTVVANVVNGNGNNRNNVIPNQYYGNDYYSWFRGVRITKRRFYELLRRCSIFMQTVLGGQHGVVWRVRAGSTERYVVNLIIKFSRIGCFSTFKPAELIDGDVATRFYTVCRKINDQYVWNHGDFQSYTVAAQQTLSQQTQTRLRSIARIEVPEPQMDPQWRYSPMVFQNQRFIH